MDPEEHSNEIIGRKNIRVLSLFSGAGAFDYYFHELNFNVVEAIDHWPDACNSYRQNYSKTNVRCADIRDIDFTKGDYTAIQAAVGSPPCQG